MNYDRYVYEENSQRISTVLYDGVLSVDLIFSSLDDIERAIPEECHLEPTDYDSNGWQMDFTQDVLIKGELYCIYGSWRNGGIAFYKSNFNI